MLVYSKNSNKDIIPIGMDLVNILCISINFYKPCREWHEDGRLYHDLKTNYHCTLTLNQPPMQVMEKMLRDHLNVINLRSRADTLTGSIVLHGNHRDRVIRWLKRMGF